ncbi:hypothetical protein BB482_03430 [Helicobacter pylori]|nr:hypothetical protein BFR58_03160 [Helicobacter pylori]PDW77164.1 hypothetical protein BB422_01310 [Helicobacter pylori]PDX52810.1 hypothetical protein BB482_03430 [Helicobacter pylori]
MGSWSRILLSILVVVLGLVLTTMLINWHV